MLKKQLSHYVENTIVFDLLSVIIFYEKKEGKYVTITK